MATLALLGTLEESASGYRAAATLEAVRDVTGAATAALRAQVGDPDRLAQALTLLGEQERGALERLRALEAAPAAFSGREHARLERLVAASPISVAVGALDGSLVMVNDAYLEMLGFTRAEYEAGEVDWVRQTPPEYVEQDARMFALAFRQGVCPPYEKVMLTRSGERLELQLTLVAAGDDEARRVIGYLQDLTPQRAQAREREAQQAQLERQVQERTQELAEQTRALNTFMEFTTQVAHTNDLHALVRAAGRLMQSVLGHKQLVYLTPEGTGLRLSAWSAGLSARLPHPLSLPASAEFLRELEHEEGPLLRRAAEVPALSALPAEEFRTLLCQPYLHDGQLRGLLVAGTGRDAWSAEERAVVEALFRGLGLAIDRVTQAARLQEQSEALVARTRALEGFALLSRELAFETDPYLLVQRAQGIVRELIGEGFAVYFELAGDTWQVRAQVGEVRDAALQARLEAGLPYTRTESLRRSWESRAASYQDTYDPGADGFVGELAAAHPVASLAAVPLLVGGDARGMFIYCTARPRSWSRADRAALGAAVHQLGLALERAGHAQALEAQRQALQDANEELEAFAYSVSHDLRTPVRHAKSFAELALRAMQSGNLEKSARHLGVVVEASERMGDLIDAMLELSRTSRQELHVQPLDLNALIEDVRRGLQAETQGRAILWAVEPLPEVHADRQLLYQVFTNLLGNAVKYTRSRPEAHIRVWADTEPHCWTLHVQDDGAGFDDRYAGKLFGVFQRLHHQHEFEGTGVGLANVRRIVVRHGGTVWATGKPGLGATFSFTLPRPGGAAL